MQANPADLSREALIDAILAFLADQDLLTLQDIRAALEREIDDAGPGAVLGLKARLGADSGWDYSPRDPLAQRIHALLADRFLAPGSELLEGHHLARVRGVPVVLVSNHLSYADANVVQVLLQRAGDPELAGRLTALAGPKVFTSRQRHFSSLCFGTVKVPQSTAVASAEAVLNSRDVARAARRSIDVARDRLRHGDALLLFGEGTRSRTAAMQPLLPGTARYLDVPGTWVLPAGLAGPEALYPVSGTGLRPARVVLRLARPILASDLLARTAGDKRLAMDAIGLAVADVLPSQYQGVYRGGAHLADARRVLGDLHGAA
jgi:1-acyl-sn-glycerol-3-phosphate acyltransferase